MKQIAYLLTAIIGLILCPACNDWLDVRPETEQKEEDQFATYSGFQEVLTGCYIQMSNVDAYGEKLTMSNIESLANLWYTTSSATGKPLTDYYLAQHDYTSDNAKEAMQDIYSALYNVIAQANLLIKHAEAAPEVFDTEAQRSIVMGEAYAIRAYCHLDVLRLYGQLPKNATQTVELPYSYTTAFNEKPEYLPFDRFVSNLEADLNEAERLLKENDPLFRYTFAELNASGSQELDDDALYFRQAHLNYWAVKALQARAYLYLGNREKAYQAASAILRGKGADGNEVMKLSGSSDLGMGYYACPNECLFYLSKNDIKEVAEERVICNEEVQSRSRYLHLTRERLDELYLQDRESNNRYLYVWNTNLYVSNMQIAGLRKYWYDDDATNKALYHQIIPMLRMSEVYLIAIESTDNLAEANSLYTTYMLDHAVQLEQDAFRSLSDVQDVVVAEYRREFFGEGQMFYTYKRLFIQDMLWSSAATSEEDYVLWNAINTEFNP